MRPIFKAGWPGYVVLVAALSVPFYVLGLLGAALPFVPALPLTAVMAMVPAAAALILAGSRDTRVALLRRLRGRLGLGWGFVALLTMPLVFWLTAATSGWVGAELPDVQWLPMGNVAASVPIFLVGAIGEELGWQGYAYPHMEQLGSALRLALILGVIWALWHVLPFWQMGHDWAWILWHGLFTVALRVLIVWLMENTGPSLIAAVLFHMMSNAPWGAIANFASFYDPRIAALLLWAVVGAIVALYGPGLRHKARDV